MAIFSMAVFGAALLVSVWAIWATITPQSARIVDLLLNGPEYAPRPVTIVAARSSLRDVKVRRVSTPALRRAAA